MSMYTLHAAFKKFVTVQGFMYIFLMEKVKQEEWVVLTYLR